MGLLMQIIGVFWTIIGLGDIIMMPWTTAEPALLTTGMIFNMLVFVFPGLIIYKLGTN